MNMVVARIRWSEKSNILFTAMYKYVIIVAIIITIAKVGTTEYLYVFSRLNRLTLPHYASNIRITSSPIGHPLSLAY